MLWSTQVNVVWRSAELQRVVSMPNYNILCRKLCENHRFWDPFKIQWGPKRYPKLTKWRQHDVKILCSELPWTVLRTDCCSRGHLYAPRPHFSWFWTLPGFILNEFRNLLVSLLALNSRIRQKLASTSIRQQQPVSASYTSSEVARKPRGAAVSPRDNNPPHPARECRAC